MSDKLHPRKTTPECEKALRKRTLVPREDWSEGYRCGWEDRELREDQKMTEPEIDKALVNMSSDELRQVIYHLLNEVDQIKEMFNKHKHEYYIEDDTVADSSVYLEIRKTSEPDNSL